MNDLDRTAGGVAEELSDLNSLAREYPVGTEVRYVAFGAEGRGTVHGVCWGLPRKEGGSRVAALVIVSFPYGGVGQVYPDEVEEKKMAAGVDEWPYPDEDPPDPL